MDRAALLRDIHVLGEWTPELGCRTPDIMHVACARQLQVDLFVTYHERQRGLAEKAGLTVAPPLESEG